MISNRKHVNFDKMIRDEISARGWTIDFVHDKLTEMCPPFQIKRLRDILKKRGGPITFYEALIFHQSDVIDIMHYIVNSDYHHDRKVRRYVEPPTKNKPARFTYK